MPAIHHVQQASCTCVTYGVCMACQAASACYLREPHHVMVHTGSTSTALLRLAITERQMASALQQHCLTYRCWWYTTDAVFERTNQCYMR
jgi:hypothetical protein